jgi:hypothetical protein
MDVLINACGSDRRWVGVAGAALIGHERADLIDDSRSLGLRSRRYPSIPCGADITARAAAAAPMERKVAVVIYAEVVIRRRRPGARAASDIVAVLAVKVWAVTAASCFHDVVAIGVDHGHKIDVVVVEEPVNVGIGIVVIQ